MMFPPIAGDADAVLASPLQMAIIALGIYGFYVLYSGYVRAQELFEDEREEIRERLADLTGWKRQMRAYGILNRMLNTRILERFRKRPEARRRMYLGVALLAAAIIAWRCVH